MNQIKNRTWLVGVVLLAIIIIVPIVIFLPKDGREGNDLWSKVNTNREHLDHKTFYKGKKFNTPQDVTKSCLVCHKDAAKSIMSSAHWEWLGKPTTIPGRVDPKTGKPDLKKYRLGKKNAINNFCLSTAGGEGSCTKCHIGYGWKDGDWAGKKGSFDFKKEANVDCLVCHDWSGSYIKGKKGMPKKFVNLAKSAGSVGYPKRQNCGVCHVYGGGGMGVKHGDIDDSLYNPTRKVDVHMGKGSDMLCIDCHVNPKHPHKILGKVYGVSVKADKDSINCTSCHNAKPHKDARLNAHTDAVACQTCHIPVYAKREPTKMWWNWSKAGDPNRKINHLHYLKIKGEFRYGQHVIPEYYWFNKSVNRYLSGDKINPKEVTILNKPLGDIHDPTAKIWPFKVHRATQPYDKIYNHLLRPILGGKGGYWKDFNWDQAFRLADEQGIIKYSGKYGFARTDMYWPLSHMVSPAKDALKCESCHGDKSRMDWKRLGYSGDPAVVGGRKNQKLLKKGE